MVSSIARSRVTLRRVQLLAGAAMASLAAAGAQAQTAETPAGEAAVGELVVTGSRIARPLEQSGSPVLVISAYQLQAQGQENLADLLSQRPQFAAAFGQSRTQSTLSAPAASGLNAVNLRNLGPTRSLVLINGRRVPSGTIGSSAVDLSTLTSANVDRVEVITGGASAIYGADAVAGVVNIITRKGFEGLEANLSYGEVLDTHDNQNPSVSVIAGHGIGERGHATLTLQYDYQGQVSCRDRYLCAEDFNWVPPGAPVRGQLAYSPVTPAGAYLIDIPGLGAVPFTQRNGSFTSGGGPIILNPAIDGYNRNPHRDLAIPTERFVAAGEATYELTDKVKAFAEFNYGAVDTRGDYEPYIFQSPVLLDRIGLTEITIPTSNPFVPAILRATAASVGDSQISWAKRLESFGDRAAVNRRRSGRIVAGLSGELESLAGLGRDWSWEASYTYGRTTLKSVTPGLIDKTRLQAALNVEADPAAPGQFRCASATARAAGCIPVNPFSTAFTAAEIAYLGVTPVSRGASNLHDAQAFLRGAVAELPAGPLTVVGGVELRSIRAHADYDTLVNTGTATGNQVSDLPSTTFRTTEGYVEARAPILADQAFAHALNVEGAFRRTAPNRGADYSTWKFGADWSPVSGVSFRIMQARAVRAPNLVDSQVNSTTVGQLIDPCAASQRNANPTRAANCAAAGIPASYVPPAITLQTIGGNVGGGGLGLRNEVGDTLTYGVAFSASNLAGAPAWAQSLSFSVDRFSIKLKDAIQQLGRQNVVNFCYDLSGAARDAYCAQVRRGTNPFAPGATFVLNGVDDRSLNVGRYRIQGIDLAASYSFSIADLTGRDWGAVSLSTDWTIYDKARLTTPAQSLDLLGYAGGSLSDQGWIKRTGRVDVGYSYGRFAADWNARYIGKARQSYAQPAGTPDIPSRWTHDARLSFAVTPQVQLYGGVNNVFDKQPPFLATGTSGTNGLDTIPGYYDVFGRQGYLGLKLRL